MERRIDSSTYDEDYFENGPIVGVSGYMNYRWMPELTIRMAHKLVIELPVRAHDTVLDFGCAKGFLVRALRILDVAAFGVDLSRYAVEHADGDVREYCRLISGCDDPALFPCDFDWLIAKDVFEHLPEEDLVNLLGRARRSVRNMFVAVPLAPDDQCGRFIIPEYDRDITHRIAKSFGWWKRVFESNGWNIDVASHHFPGCKENWTKRWSDGNGFFVMSKGQVR